MHTFLQEKVYGYGGKMKCSHNQQTLKTKIGKY